MRPLILALAGSVLCAGCAAGPERSPDPAARRAGPESSPAPGPARGPGGFRAEAPTIVRVSAEVVEVRVVLVNDGTQPVDVGARLARRPGDGAAASGLVLVEEAVPKKSFVLRDARDRPLCSTGLTPLAPGERRTVWARFPAPGSPVVTVEVPGLPAFRSVEVPSADRLGPGL